jgi:prepilin-type processing-associated H-X9-DG protein
MKESNSHLNTNPRRIAKYTIVSLVILSAISAAAYPLFALARSGNGRNICASNLKNFGTAIAIYQSDSNDCFPPYFTFDGGEQKKLFIEATLPYMKSTNYYFCEKEPAGQYLAAERLKDQMSYGHSTRLTTVIPGFEKGNRLIKMPDDESLSRTVPYLRDPYTGSWKTGHLTYDSWHEYGFNTLFLDGHVAVQKNIDQLEPRFTVAPKN